MKLAGFLGWISAVTLAVACSSSGGDGDDGGNSSGNPSGNPSGGGATPQEIKSCKDACDQQKFFDCHDAQDQANCYDDCSKAGSDQIELFVACVDAGACDEECDAFIEPSDPSGGSGASGPTGGGGGDTTSSASCSSDGCENPTGCTQACESLQFFSCIDVADFNDCSALCLTASEEDQTQFASCVTSASGQCDGVDCYYSFNPNAVPGPTPQQVADCKMACEDLNFFDCLTGPEAAECAASCDEATKETIEAFLICVEPTDCPGSLQCFQ